MSVPVGIDLSVGALAFGVLAFRGPDAARFLQGQLSADVERLAPRASTLAGLHNPQGRVIALLALTRTAPDEILAALPAELCGVVAQRLGKYLLRAKLRISDETATYRVLGVPRDAARDIVEIAWTDRRLLLVPRDREYRDSGAGRAAWELQDVAAGIAQVYAAISEQFVAQMLNLDLLGAIAFDKGCYTGQEIIARAHYRGRVKRRMQRWLDVSDAQLKPGDAALGPDARALTVVSVARSDRGQELLAVGTFGSVEVVERAAQDSAPRATVAGPLPLPYALPE